MHRYRISFTVFIYSRHFPKPEPDPNPGFCGLPNPKPGFSKKAPGLESLVTREQIWGLKVKGTKNVKKTFFAHIFVKSGSIYVKPGPKWLMAYSTHIIGYISPAEMRHFALFVCLSVSHIPVIPVVTLYCSVVESLFVFRGNYFSRYWMLLWF